MNKLITGLTAGAVVGAAFGVMVVPNLDRKTQKILRKASKKVVDIAGESIHWAKL